MFAILKFMTRKCIIDSRKNQTHLAISGHDNKLLTFTIPRVPRLGVRCAFFFRCFSHGSAVESASLWRATSLGHTRALSFRNGNIGDVVHHKKMKKYTYNNYEDSIMIHQSWYNET